MEVAWAQWVKGDELLGGKGIMKHWVLVIFT
jgi:hypothetical protein